MGNRDDRARETFEIFFQPCHRFGIQMVGRLIEQQHIRLGEQQPAKRHAAPFATRQLFYVRIPRWQAQGVSCDFQLAFDLPPVLGIDFGLQITLFTEESVHLLVIHGLRKFFADRIEAGHQFKDIGYAFLHVAAHILGRVQFGFLGQIADSDAGLRPRFTFYFRIDSGHDPE